MIPQRPPIPEKWRPRSLSRWPAQNDCIAERSRLDRFCRVAETALQSLGKTEPNRADRASLWYTEKNRPCVPLLISGTQGRFFRSEEHTSELQSRENLVCRLLLEKKKR